MSVLQGVAYKIVKNICGNFHPYYAFQGVVNLQFFVREKTRFQFRCVSGFGSGYDSGFQLGEHFRFRRGTEHAEPSAVMGKKSKLFMRSYIVALQEV